ncbi:MAG TPA: hypothetical protein VMF52_02245 [Steroidobacteraceae bacterium]|nr:hypothetical protein [Steroidobacteraceae bacterium]
MSDVIDEVVNASRNWAGDAPTGAMLSALRAFLAAAEKDESVVREAAAVLVAQSTGSIAWMSLSFGTWVERGGPAALTGPAVLEQLLAWLPKLPTPDVTQPKPDPTPAQKRLLTQFPFLCQSVVTHLARMPVVRASMGQDAALLQRLDVLGAYSNGAWWVHEALVKSSGTLVLLHPPSGTGLRLSYTNVSNNFHLFSLLQTAVGTSLPGGRVPDETVAFVARGKSSEAVGDEAWWHYGNASSPTPDVMQSIWGEWLARDIPRVNGEQVILLWPMILKQRLWEAAFLGPHLEAMPADASIERMLTPDECAAWLNTLGIGKPRKPWWRIW